MEEFVSSEYIYLLQTREFLRLNQPVYKIGRTTQSPDKRIGQYPKNSKLFLIMSVADCVEKETILLRLFRKEFLARKDYGSEYFEGDVQRMIDLITDTLRPPKDTQKCESCKLSINSNHVGSVFCCGVFHNICLERMGLPTCPICQKKYTTEKLYISNPTLLTMFKPSSFCDIVSDVKKATVCAAYGDRYDPESINEIVTCLATKKPTYLFINPYHSNYERQFFDSTARLCEESVKSTYKIHSYMCFQPLDIQFDSWTVSDTIASLNYGNCHKWADVTKAPLHKPIKFVESTVDELEPICSLFPSKSQLQRRVECLINT